MKGNRSKLLVLAFGFAIGMSLANPCFGASADEWVGKAVNAAGSLARGDAGGAAQQAVGGANIPLSHQAHLSAGLGGVNFQQPLLPRSNNPYLNAGSTYNAGANYGFNRPPDFSQNVQVSGGNKYISNTTTVSGNLNRE